MSLSSLDGATPSAGETLRSWRQRGTAPYELWYGAQWLAGNTGGALTIPGDTLLLHPFLSPYSGVIDRLSFELTATAASGKARVGIYRVTSRTNLYPAGLVVDGGEFLVSAANGVKTTNINIVLDAAMLYYFAFLGNTSQATANYRASNPGGLEPMGAAATLGASFPVTGLQVSQAYGALPSTVPAGATNYTGSVPMTLVRYAS